MIDAGRFAQVIYGLRLILRIEPGGLSFFEKTYPGFIRSFFPALVLAPLQLLESTLKYAAMSAKPDALSYTIIEALFYVVSWTLFPYAMIYISALLGRSGRYFDYIVPYNWLQLALGLVALPLSILTVSNLISPEGAGFLGLMVWAVALVYYTFLARIALLLPLLTAFGVVVLDVVLAIGSNMIVEQMEIPPQAAVVQEGGAMPTIEVTGKRLQP